MGALIPPLTALKPVIVKPRTVGFGEITLMLWQPDSRDTNGKYTFYYHLSRQANVKMALGNDVQVLEEFDYLPDDPMAAQELMNEYLMQLATGYWYQQYRGADDQVNLWISPDGVVFGGHLGSHTSMAAAIIARDYKHEFVNVEDESGEDKLLNEGWVRIAPSNYTSWQLLTDAQVDRIRNIIDFPVTDRHLITRNDTMQGLLRDKGYD